MDDFIAWWNQANMTWVIICVVIIGVYFLPTIVARNRKHNNVLSIFVLNLLSVFTGGIAWIVALVWACTNNSKK